MPKQEDWALDILSRFGAIEQFIRQAPLYLGSSTGSGGGSGGPVGGFIGMLPQTRVAGNTDESFLYAQSSGSLRHLRDELDRLRAYAEPAHQFYATSGSPATNVITISSGSWHHTDAAHPLIFTGGTTPPLSAPSSGSRFDLLIINTTGTLGWVHGTEAANPTMPNVPSSSGSLPLWMILARAGGTAITKYDNGTQHYIFRDYRPFLNAGGAASSGSLIVQDEGNTITLSAGTLNFTGAGITATQTGSGVVAVNVPSSSGSPTPNEWLVSDNINVGFRPNQVRTVGSNGRYTTIQSAIDASNSGDVILIAPGSYTGATTVNKNVHITGIGAHPRDTLTSVQISVSAGNTVSLSNLQVHISFDTGVGVQADGTVYCNNLLVDIDTGDIYHDDIGYYCRDGGRMYLYNCEFRGLSQPGSIGIQANAGGVIEAIDCIATDCSSAAVLSVGRVRLSSGSFAGSPDFQIQGTGTMQVSGARWRTTSGSINFLDYPNNVVTVGSAHSHYSSIATAIANSAGFASASNPVKILIEPGTYNESFTIGNYQEVIGAGRTVIINGTVTLNGTSARLELCRIAPTSGTALVVSGGNVVARQVSFVPSSGSSIQVTAGAASFISNTLSTSTQGVVLSGGIVLLDNNFHNSGNNTICNGATVFADDWFDTLTITSGTVTLGAKASANTFTFSGGTVSGRTPSLYLTSLGTSSNPGAAAAILATTAAGLLTLDKLNLGSGSGAGTGQLVASDDLFPFGDEWGLFSRATQAVLITPDTHFTTSQSPVSTWSGAPFATPSSVSLTALPSILRVFDSSANTRSFAYETVSIATNGALALRARLTCMIGVERCGLRMDDGTDTNHVELALRSQGATNGLCDLIRVSNGVVTTVIAGLELGFYTLQLVASTDTNVYAYYTRDGTGFSFIATVASGRGYTITRAGIIHTQGTAAGTADRTSSFDSYQSA